jgi:nucleoside-diphosphate-sugar epimerase
MNEISIYGSTGFIGSEYHRLYGGHRIPRDKYLPKTDNLLYFISTVDNYNIFNNYTKDIDTNLTVLMEVLNMSRQMYPNFTFNFISSWFVYGKTDDLPASEESICNPTGFYSITKRAAEQMLICYCKTFGVNYRILRLGNVYGTGDGKVSKKKNALQFLINQIKNNDPINLYNKGQNIRDFSHVTDICED